MYVCMYIKRYVAYYVFPIEQWEFVSKEDARLSYFVFIETYRLYWTQSREMILSAGRR